MADPSTTDIQIPALAVPHDEFMGSIAAQATDRLQEVQAFEQRVYAILQEIQAERTALLKILRATSQEPLAARPVKRRSRTGKGYTRISQRRVDAIRDHIVSYFRENPTGTITQLQVTNELGFSHSGITSEAFQVLRDEQLIRQAGLENRRKLYKLTAQAETEYAIA